MIECYQKQHPEVVVSHIQETVGLSNNGIYYKHKEKKPETELKNAIESIYLQLPYYGYPRITAQLRRQGLKVNHKKVYNIMGELYLLHFRKNTFKPKTTDSRHTYVVYTNEIKYLGKVPSMITEE